MLSTPLTFFSSDYADLMLLVCLALLLYRYQRLYLCSLSLFPSFSPMAFPPHSAHDQRFTLDTDTLPCHSSSVSFSQFRRFEASQSLGSRATLKWSSVPLGIRDQNHFLSYGRLLSFLVVRLFLGWFCFVLSEHWIVSQRYAYASSSRADQTCVDRCLLPIRCISSMKRIIQLFPRTWKCVLVAV